MNRTLLQEAHNTLLAARHSIRNLLQGTDKDLWPKHLAVSDATDVVREQIAAALAAPQPEPVAWQGAEEWESLAFELCANENGEGACNELIWEGGPIKEPWGERWLKYEDEAKRMIALVRKHVAAPPAAPADMVMVPKEPTHEMLYAMAELDGWRKGDRDHPMFTRWRDYWYVALAAAPAPAVPDDIAAIIACLGDDAALLRETTDDSEEIAQNMDDAAAALERLSAAPAVPVSWDRLRTLMDGIPTREEFIGGQRQKYVAKEAVMSWLHEGQLRAEREAAQPAAPAVQVVLRQPNLFASAPAVPLTDTRKLCTCDGAGRGPGRACVVQAGGRLGELWKCAKSAAPAVREPQDERIRWRDAVIKEAESALRTAEQEFADMPTWANVGHAAKKVTHALAVIAALGIGGGGNG